MADTNDPDKAQARALAFEDDETVETVEHTGKAGTAKYDVRPLTLEDAREARRKSMKAVKNNGKTVMEGGRAVLEVDAHELGIRNVMASVYHHGTNERVYSEKDLPALMGMRSGSRGLLTKFTMAVSRVNKVDPEEEAGKSEGPEGGPSSD